MKSKVQNVLVSFCIMLSVTTVSGCGNSNVPATSSAVVAAGAAGSSVAQKRAAVATKEQFSPASETQTQLQEMKLIPACSLEDVVSLADNSPNPGVKPNSYLVKKGVAYRLIGFAANVEADSVPGSIQIVLEGQQIYALNTATGSNRPDVGKFFKKPNLSLAGFQGGAAFDDVAAGDYNIFVLEEGAPQVLCPTHQTVTVM